MQNQMKHKDQGYFQARRVWFTGSVALAKGQGVCYDSDRGTAATRDETRNAYVELPNSGNNYSFAGVCTRAYTAQANGQMIEIWTPGGLAEILVDAAITIGDQAFVTCLAGLSGSTMVGKFSATHAGKGFMGRGTAKVLQTASEAGLVLAQLMDGPESGLLEVVPGATLTAGGASAGLLVGGVTLFTGGVTPASNYTATLASGKYSGQRKRFGCLGTLTTNDAVITVTAGEQLDGSTDLASITQDAANEDSLLEWGGIKWRLMHNAGSALA